MSFQQSACDIHLNPEREGTTSLVAICNNDEGSGLTSKLPLDNFLGNKDGHFVWGGKNITQSCRNMQLRREGPNRLPILHADLRNSAGDFVPADCHLEEHIWNIDGELLYKPDMD
ncbi:hypothetical protein HFD88_004912 [Aspergillus terreus]|nr:hypothetical protein HFD88_004912 [Aspergillus terreus]